MRQAHTVLRLQEACGGHELRKQRRGAGRAKLASRYKNYEHTLMSKVQDVWCTCAAQRYVMNKTVREREVGVRMDKGSKQCSIHCKEEMVVGLSVGCH